MITIFKVSWVLLVLSGCCHGKLLQTTLNVYPETREVQAQETITFRMRAKYVAGYPAKLVENKAKILFVGLYGLEYNQALAATYVQCNYKETTSGGSLYFEVQVEEFVQGRDDLDCNITMTMAVSLPPGSTFYQTLDLSWQEESLEENPVKSSQKSEHKSDLKIPKLKMSLELNDGTNRFYTCGPPYLGINIVLDFPKCDLSELEVELRWPLGGTSPDIEIIRLFENQNQIGVVKPASGVTAGALSSRQETGDLTAGVFKLVNIQANGQSSASFKDIIIEARLKVVNEFKPLPYNTPIEIGAKLTHPARSDASTISLSYTSSLTFYLDGPEVHQRWECEQLVNGGYTAVCTVWVSNKASATTPAMNVKLVIANVDPQLSLDSNNIEYTEPYSINAADQPTTKPSNYIGNTDTGLTIASSIPIQKQIKVKIPFKIGTANVGPISAAKMTITYKNDYTTPCNKDLGNTQLNFVMMIPTFPMEKEKLASYFPTNMVVGQELTIDFPMEVPQGNMDIIISLTTNAEGASKTKYNRGKRSDPNYAKALELLSVEVTSPYKFIKEVQPKTGGWGITFEKFTNPVNTEITEADKTNFRVKLKMHEDAFLDSGDLIDVVWDFTVNGYNYQKIFKMVVGEPDIAFSFLTEEKAGQIEWKVTGYQKPGTDRSTAHEITYKVIFNKDIPVVAKTYSTQAFQSEKVTSDVVNQYWWYQKSLATDGKFDFSFKTYLEDSGSVLVQAEYQALPKGTPNINNRKYVSSYEYPVQLHQTNNARNLRLGLAAAVCFFIGILVAMLVMLVCCKRTTVLPLPTKFELYSRRPIVRINRWIKQRGDPLLLAEMADDVVESLTEKEYKTSLHQLDRLDIAHTVHAEEESSKQQRQLILESVGWIVTVSDLKDVARKLFQQLDTDFKKSEVALAEEEMKEEAELETELQKKATESQEKLLEDQDVQIDQLVTTLQSVPFQERVEFVELMKEQHEIQRNDLEKLLRMQLEEARERVRRDYLVRKRVNVNVLVNDFFDALADAANLNNDVKDDIISRSKHYIEIIDEAFKEEGCRIKFVLEERLLKREAILKIKEERVKYHTNLMANMSGSMKQTINRLVRDSLIRRSYGEELLSQINITSNQNKQQMMDTMKTYEDSIRDTIRSKSQEKTRDLLNSHLEAYELFQQTYNEKLSNKEISPVEFLERKVRFYVGCRMEKEQLIDELDNLISQELAMVWDHFTSESITRFRENQDKTFEVLIKKAIIGSSQSEVQKQRNFRDQSKLETEKNNAIRMIEAALKERVSESEERIKSQVEAEKMEQKALKEQEAKMVERLLESQLMMNEETREKIMKEHKKNLLELEEGLTVQKISFKRKKEEKMSVKKMKRMEKLTDKQQNERDLFTQGEGRTDDTMQTLLRRQHSERMDLLSAVESLDLREVEQIHDDITAEKNEVLMAQKRRLATMLASLQVQKSREVATLRGQLNALTKVELNLIDDLASRGVLEETKAKGMVDEHIKAVDGKVKEINETKERQKKLQMIRIETRLKAQEEELVARHQQQAEEITAREDKSPAYMYKKMLLLQKQKNERKSLRDNVRIETDQTIEEVERKFELMRLKEIKKMELKFISELIQHADFDREELVDVFRAMFVTRSQKELEEVLKHSKDLTVEEKEKRGPTTLLDRAKQELVKRQGSQRFQLTAKRQGLLKPKSRSQRISDVSKMFPRSIRTVAQEAMLNRHSALSM